MIERGGERERRMGKMCMGERDREREREREKRCSVRVCDNIIYLQCVR